MNLQIVDKYNLFCISGHPCSKNQCGMGLSSVITNLAYSPSIEELSLTAITLRAGGSTTELSDALEKLFSLTVSLKKVCF